MAKIKPATREELEKIKDHFEASGYGRISDETANAQKDCLKILRTNPERLRNGKS